MRGPRKLSGCGLAAVAAVALLLSGCGGSGNNSAAGTTSPTSSSSAATTTNPPTVADQMSPFCVAARNFAAQAATAIAGGLQNPSLPQQLPQLASQLQSVTPPPEIAADWQTVISSIQQLGQAIQGVNLSDPQQAAAAQQKVAPIEAQLTTAGQKINTYLVNNCGLSTGITQTSTTS